MSAAVARVDFCHPVRGVGHLVAGAHVALAAVEGGVLVRCGEQPPYLVPCPNVAAIEPPEAWGQPQKGGRR